MVVELGLFKLDFNCLLQFPAAPLRRFVFFPHLRTRYWVLVSVLLQFPQLLYTDPETSCGFHKTSEASGPEEEACSLFRFLEIKQTDLGFEVILPSSILEFSSTWWLPFQLNENGAREHQENHDVKQSEKMGPFTTSETAFRHQLCEFVFGVNLLDLDL